MQEKVISAIGVSPGIALGPVRIISSSGHHPVPEERTVAEAELDGEIGRFQEALDRTRDDLVKLQHELNLKLKSSDPGIFDAHLLIVEDRMLTREVVEIIRERHLAAESAFYLVIERYVKALTAMSDNYIRERAADIRDVGSRVLSHLLSREHGGLGLELPGECVVMARELTPSDTAKLDRSKVLAFATETGSRSSHSAILARSMQIPALVGLPPAIFEQLHDGEEVIVDGGAGRLIVNPGRETAELYRAKFREEQKLFEELMKGAQMRPDTLDGFSVQLSANIESVEDLTQLERFGSCGIGLFRTEFMFMNVGALPDEEAQLAVYRRLLEGVAGDPVVIRTLDIGGDKFADLIGMAPEANPALGVRGIRFSLNYGRELFKTQLRALLRAAPFGNLKVMLPMVVDVEEITEVKAIVVELVEELHRSKVECADHLELGAMIETPSAALMSEALARESDFFSIGTNDLVQYTLCMDRGNERVAYMYRPAHPAVAKLIRNCVLAARERNIWVGVCGEIAGDPLFTALLVGLGVHELSMPPASIGPVRHVIGKLRLRDAEALAARALMCDTAAEAMRLCRAHLQQVAPEILALITGEL